MDVRIDELRRFALENEELDSHLYRGDDNVNLLIRKNSEKYQLYYNLQHADHNLKQGGGSILFAILRNGGEITQRKLAKMTPYTPQSIAEALKLLEKRGFIEREVQTHDRRKRRIIITEKGLSVLSYSLPMRKEFNDKLVRCLKPDEWSTLIDLITRLNNFYDKEIKKIKRTKRNSNNE